MLSVFNFKVVFRKDLSQCSISRRIDEISLNQIGTFETTEYRLSRNNKNSNDKGERRNATSARKTCTKASGC